MIQTDSGIFVEFGDTDDKHLSLTAPPALPYFVR